MHHAKLFEPRSDTQMQMQVLVSLITHVPTFMAVFIIFWQDLEGVEELIREHQDNLVAIGEVCESLMLKPERHTLIRKEQGPFIWLILLTVDLHVR